MINLIQNFLIYLISKRKNEFEIFTPYQILKKASNVLIMLPDEKESAAEIKFLLPVFDKLFKQKTFLISSNVLDEFFNNIDIPKIIYGKEQKNFINLPKKNFIKQLQLKNFDTIIDCNLRDSNFHYWLTKSLNAKFKIGLYRKNSTLFNNLVMKVRNFESIKKTYENFLFILKL